MDPMMLLTLCAIVSETLYEAPARFPDHLPIAQLRLAGQPVSLLIDSGSNRSVLFSGGPLTGSVSAKGVSLGKFELGRLETNEMSPDAARMMRGMGVDGALGDDFLRTHDVLIDYRRQRIFIGDDHPVDEPNRLILQANPRESIDLKRAKDADLVEQDERYFVPATVGADTACLMALDTGTGESSLPMELAKGFKTTGFSRVVVGFQGRRARAMERIAKIAIGAGPPLELKVLAGDQRGPILGGNAFDRRCLLLRLAASKAWYW